MSLNALEWIDKLEKQALEDDEFIYPTNVACLLYHLKMIVEFSPSPAILEQIDYMLADIGEAIERGAVG